MIEVQSTGKDGVVLRCWFGVWSIYRLHGCLFDDYLLSWNAFSAQKLDCYIFHMYVYVQWK